MTGGRFYYLLSPNDTTGETARGPYTLPEARALSGFADKVLSAGQLDGLRLRGRVWAPVAQAAPGQRFELEGLTVEVISNRQVRVRRPGSDIEIREM